MSENVIHLSFKSPHMVDDAMSFIACRVFLNKTYTLIEDRPNDFQLEVRCMLGCAWVGLKTTDDGPHRWTQFGANGAILKEQPKQAARSPFADVEEIESMERHQIADGSKADPLEDYQ